MPLELIPHQPYFEDPNRPPAGPCIDDPEYCHLIAPGDAMWIQWKQTPCGINEVEDEDFTDVSLGAQILTEPEFTTAATWTFNALEWVHGGGKITHQTGNTGVLSQATGLAAGWHKITLIITDQTAGSVNVAISTGSAGTSADFTENGTYELYLYYAAGAAIQITPTSDFDGAIDACRLYAATFNKWTIGTPWIPQIDGGICKDDDTATATATESVANYINANGLYQAEITISNYGGVGSVTVRISDAATANISGNGTHKIYGEPTVNGVMEIEATADFTGCVTLVDTRALKNDYDFVIDDGASETSIAGGDITYFENWITLQVAPENYLADFGCFTIAVRDECDYQSGEYVFNGNITGGSPTGAPNWKENNPGQTDLSSNKITATYTTGAGHSKTTLTFNDPQPLYQDNVGQVTNYRITFDIVAITPVVGDGIETELAPSAADMGAGVQIFGQTTAITKFTGVGTHTYDVALPAGHPTNEVTQTNRAQVYHFFDIDGSGLANAGTVEVTNIRIAKLAPYEKTFITECLKYTPATGSVLIQGTCSGGVKLGFNWDTNFILQQRVRGRVLTAEYPLTDEQYDYSSGNSSKNYADRSKAWEMFFDLAPESVHDTVSVQIQCSTLGIGSTSADLVAYIAEAEYTPQYERTGASEMAQSTLKLKTKSENKIFNRNC